MSHSLKVTTESPLCVNTVQDPNQASRSRGETRSRRVGRPCRGRTVHVSAERPGRGCSQDQPPAGTAESGKQFLVDLKSLLRLKVDS